MPCLAWDLETDLGDQVMRSEHLVVSFTFCNRTICLDNVMRSVTFEPDLNLSLTTHLLL